MYLKHLLGYLYCRQAEMFKMKRVRQPFDIKKTFFERPFLGLKPICYKKAQTDFVL